MKVLIETPAIWLTIVRQSLCQTDFSGSRRFVAIFRRKTLDEIALDGNRFGTHKLIPLKTRFQGQDAAGHQDLLRRVTIDPANGQQSERFVNNFLNFRVENFNVKEEGSLQDIIRYEQQSFNIQPTGGPQEDFGFLNTNA